MNEQIKHARDIAIGILNPSKTELEHGLAIHKESVVVESYSLGVMAPLDGKRL